MVKVSDAAGCAGSGSHIVSTVPSQLLISKDSPSRAPLAKVIAPSSNQPASAGSVGVGDPTIFSPELGVTCRLSAEEATEPVCRHRVTSTMHSHFELISMPLSPEPNVVRHIGPYW